MSHHRSIIAASLLAGTRRRCAAALLLLLAAAAVSFAAVHVDAQSSAVAVILSILTPQTLHQRFTFFSRLNPDGTVVDRCFGSANRGNTFSFIGQCDATSNLEVIVYRYPTLQMPGLATLYSPTYQILFSLADGFLMSSVTPEEAHALLADLLPYYSFELRPVPGTREIDATTTYQLYHANSGSCLTTNSDFELYAASCVSPSPPTSPPPPPSSSTATDGTAQPPSSTGSAGPSTDDSSNINNDSIFLHRRRRLLQSNNAPTAESQRFQFGAPIIAAPPPPPPPSSSSTGADSSSTGIESSTGVQSSSTAEAPAPSSSTGAAAGVVAPPPVDGGAVGTPGSSSRISPGPDDGEDSVTRSVRGFFTSPAAIVTSVATIVLSSLAGLIATMQLRQGASYMRLLSLLWKDKLILRAGGMMMSQYAFLIWATLEVAMTLVLLLVRADYAPTMSGDFIPRRWALPLYGFFVVLGLTVASIETACCRKHVSSRGCERLPNGTMIAFDWQRRARSIMIFNVFLRIAAFVALVCTVLSWTDVTPPTTAEPLAWVLLITQLYSSRLLLFVIFVTVPWALLPCTSGPALRLAKQALTARPYLWDEQIDAYQLLEDPDTLLRHPSERYVDRAHVSDDEHERAQEEQMHWVKRDPAQCCRWRVHFVRPGTATAAAADAAGTTVAAAYAAKKAPPAEFVSKAEEQDKGVGVKEVAIQVRDDAVTSKDGDGAVPGKYEQQQQHVVTVQRSATPALILASAQSPGAASTNSRSGTLASQPGAAVEMAQQPATLASVANKPPTPSPSPPLQRSQAEEKQDAGVTRRASLPPLPIRSGSALQLHNPRTENKPVSPALPPRPVNAVLNRAMTQLHFTGSTPTVMTPAGVTPASSVQPTPVATPLVTPVGSPKAKQRDASGCAINQTAFAGTASDAPVLIISDAVDAAADAANSDSDSRVSSNLTVDTGLPDSKDDVVVFDTDSTVSLPPPQALQQEEQLKLQELQRQQSVSSKSDFDHHVPPNQLVYAYEDSDADE